MPTKFRFLAILLLTFTTFAAAIQDAEKPKASARRSPAHKTSAAAKHTPAKQTAAKPAAKVNKLKKTGKGATPAASRKSVKMKVSPEKVRRLKRAFVASADLKVMARQLVQNRTPAAFNGVEDYARRHPASDAGALAWLAAGYAHVQDQQYAQAVVALEKAKPHAGELFDYVRYLEAVCYAGQGNSAKVAELLHNFDTDAPESIFLNDVVDIYGSALLAQSRTPEAITYLEAHRVPQRASVELALGKSYLHSTHPEKGMEILKHLYFTMPLSEQAADAGTLLAANGSALEGSYTDEKARADLLAKAGRWNDAVRAYRALEGRAPATELSSVEISLAASLRHTNEGESRDLLGQVQAVGEVNAQRLYQLGEIARNDNNKDAVIANLEGMRQSCAASPWFEQALISAANMYLLDKNYDRAIDLFREAQQRFPGGARPSYSHWKAAWLTYRQGRSADAKRDFENQVAWYPDRPEVPAALYWRARIAEDEHDYTLARAWYTKLGERFHNYYYGYLGRERLAGLPPSATDVALRQDATLAHIPEMKPAGPEAQELEPPPNQLRAEKSRLLVNAGLNEFAIRELQAEQGGQGARWATLQIARIYADGGETHRAIQFLKKSLPGYYSIDLAGLPRAYWEILFPKVYWSDLQRQAEANSLDPYLVASLIRQESEFNPNALSHANACGLMQLLPKVGKGEAKAAHMKGFSTSSLFAPSINIQLGTHYFREMVTQYNGQVEYALAAYNAGSNRVDDWRQSGHYRDIQEFVESIPFTETREYVQAIVRNAKVYERLYPRP
jgi:soluble lytic murein transglycosylase